MLRKIKEEYIEFKILLKEVPLILTILFIVTIIAMNILANKSINIDNPYLALDCGIIVSWFSFLVMDIITKHFGPKAATELSILAIFINLILCLFFLIGGLIPGTWGESYVSGSENIINTALDNTISGTWYVILGSTIAFLVSAIVNNFTNFGIGKLFKKDNKLAYYSRTYISTMLGQFIDNLLFALIVSHIFFGWSFIECVTCSITGMLVELLCEIIFSSFGYKITNKWKKDNIGLNYFKYIEEKKHGSISDGI